MKKIIIFSLLCLFLTEAYSQCADTANIYAFTFSGKSYEVIKEFKSWNDAGTCATERGGYLVEINNLTEQNAVYDAIINGAGVSPTYVTIDNGGGIAYVWIGATDNNNEGTWLWDGNNDSFGNNFWNGQGSGVAVGGAYINWGGTNTGILNEPDNYDMDQDNAAIALAGWPSGTTILGIAGEWNDIIGSSPIYYVVEYDSTSTSTGIIFYENPVFEVYPNPSNGIFIINNQDVLNMEYSVLDLNGRVLKTGIIQNEIGTIDLTTFEPGIYILKISSEDGNVITKKLIKN